MANTISDPTLLGWSVREPDKFLIVQQQYAITIGAITSSAVQTTAFAPGADISSLPASVTNVIGLVWTPEVLAAQQTADQAAEAARLAAFNAAIAGVDQAISLAAANGQDGLVVNLQSQKAQLIAARDAGMPFEP